MGLKLLISSSQESFSYDSKGNKNGVNDNSSFNIISEDGRNVGYINLSSSVSVNNSDESFSEEIGSISEKVKSLFDKLNEDIKQITNEGL